MYFETGLAGKARKFARLMLGRPAFPPGDVTIEVTTRCARGCAMCFRGPLGVEPADMKPEVYRAALAALKEAYRGGGPRYINFVGLGEPFCHPDLPGFLRLAAAEFPSSELNLSTGLDPFDRAAFAALVGDGVLNRLSVSLDGEGTGGGLHGFSGTVRGNLAFLKELSSSGTGFKLRAQTLISSREAVLSAVRLAAEAGAGELQLMRLDLHAFGGAAPLARPGYAEERAIVREASALGASLGLRCRCNNSYNVFMRLASAGGSRCLISDDHIFISASGEVLPCFGLRRASHGNIASAPLASMTASRRSFFRRQAELCRGCDIYAERHRAEAA